MLDFGKAFADTNALAVFVGAVAAFGIGSVWYSPVLFSKAWVKELGWKKDFMNDPKVKAKLPMIFAGDLVVTVFLALGVSMLMDLLSVDGLWNGLAVGAFALLFFSATTTGINYLFERRSLKLFAINSGYALSMGLVIGAVLGLWPK